MKKTVKALLHALSYGDIEVESSRRFADLKQLDPMRIFVKKLDERICRGNYEIPVRVYFPSEEAMEMGLEKGHRFPILLFFHGGGWVTECVENYDRVCAQMSQSTAHIVVSVEYRLAPEYKFPTGLLDCYEAARSLFMNSFLLHTDPNRITLVGDSAGGNLAAAVSMMARDLGEFMPRRQILIYPATNSDYSEQTPFRSVIENGQDYLLTRVKMESYIKLYERTEKDRENPYFAPIRAKDFRNLPDTLILTAEFDPLRDEGEAYGKCLREAGNTVRVERIPDALHGFFALGIRHLHVQESFDHMNRFLREEETVCGKEEDPDGVN